MTTPEQRKHRRDAAEWSADQRRDEREERLEYLANRTKTHGEMCPCGDCKEIRKL